MFLAMSPKYKPWDNLKLRQAVCYAVDRDLIIKNVLKGQADRLDGPIGPGQYGYDAEYTKKNLIIAYDPAVVNTNNPMKFKDITSNDFKLGVRWALGGPVAAPLEAPLMRIPWFARWYPRWKAWKDHVLTIVRQSRPWRLVRALNRRISRGWRRFREG